MTTDFWRIAGVACRIGAAAPRASTGATAKAGTTASTAVRRPGSDALEGPLADDPRWVAVTTEKLRPGEVLPEVAALDSALVRHAKECYEP